jgi:cobalt-zinc-cadmium resistance protein CzcA
VLEKLIETCVHRRVAAVFAVAVMAAFGVRAYLNTPIEAYPDVTNAQVTVIAQMPGYAPEEVERSVTVPLERVLNGTPRTIQLRSESLFGLSLVTLTFDDDADPFISRMHVAQRIASADMPDGVIPVLAPEATPLGEVYQFRMVSDRHDLYQLRAELQWTVSRVLKQVPGVADVVSFGGYLKEVHVRADPDRLRAHGVALGDVADALSKTNINVGGGFLRHGDQELTVRGMGYIGSVDDIRRTVLKTRDSTPVMVGDLAEIVQSNTPRRGAVGYNEEKEAVEGFVLMRRGENPSRVLDGVHDRVKEMNDKILPKGMRIEPFYDRTLLVGNTLQTVNKNLLHGFLLVVGIAWLFFRSVTGSLIVASVIPLALLGAFVGLYVLKLPANLISMGAIDFGILVDGAVVLVENVLHAVQHERLTKRRDVLHLIIRAAEQVARPTLYAMLIIIAALVPVFTLEQVEGRIFRPLALTYSFALAAALVLALTLVPALCALGFARGRSVSEPGWLEAARRRYAGWLARALGVRRWIVVVAALFFAATLVLGAKLGTEFLPELDEGDILVFVEMPPSIAQEAAQTMLVEVRRRILTFPEVSNVLSENGRPEDGTDNENPNMSETFVRLRPRSEWRAGYDKRRLADEMRELVSEIPGVRYNFSQPIKDNVEEAVAGVRGKVVLKVFGTDTAVMRDSLEQARLRLAGVAGIIDLGLYRDATVPQLQIRLDRDAVARAGLTVAAVRQGGHHFLGGRAAGSGPADGAGGGAQQRPDGRRAGDGAAGRRQRGAARHLEHRRGDRRRQHLSRIEQPLPGAQVQRRGARHGLGGERRHRHRRCRRQAARRLLLPVGRRIREPAARHPAARDHRAGGAGGGAGAALRRDPVRARRARHPARGALRHDRRRVRAEAGRHAAVGERGGRVHRAARPGVAARAAAGERHRGAAPRRPGARRCRGQGQRREAARRADGGAARAVRPAADGVVDRHRQRNAAPVRPGDCRRHGDHARDYPVRAAGDLLHDRRPALRHARGAR